MGQVSYKSGKCENAVIIGYNISFGNDPQPLYKAGSSTIECVVEMESLATAAISRAIFKDSQFTQESGSGTFHLNAPSLTLKNAVVKYNYSASSGQAYVVEQLQITGKRVV